MDWVIANLIAVKLTYDTDVEITVVCDALGKTVAGARNGCNFVDQLLTLNRYSQNNKFGDREFLLEISVILF